MLTVVVFIHELGHFLVARWCGVQVKAFSIGFGREIFGFYDRYGTRWRFAWIPLGGYVKFLDDENSASVPSRDALATHDARRARRRVPDQTAGRRGAAIVAAGPIANFLLAIADLRVDLHVRGRARDGAARRRTGAGRGGGRSAGFKAGDVIVSIDGQPIESFADMQRIVSASADQRADLRGRPRRRAADAQGDARPARDYRTGSATSCGSA